MVTSMRLRHVVPMLLVAVLLIVAALAVRGTATAGASERNETTAAFDIAANSGGQQATGEAKAIPAALLAGVAARVAAKQAAKFAGKAFAGGFFGALGAKVAGIFGSQQAQANTSRSEVVLDAAR